MQDAETKTLWNHITGEAVYGPLPGKSVGPISNLLHMTVAQALAIDPATRVAISDQTYVAGGKRFGTASRGAIVGGSSSTTSGSGSGGARGRRSPMDSPNATMNDRFASTLGAEDARRPRMDLGLGVWTGTTKRYYPVAVIRERGEAFVDRVDGRNVLVYIEQESNTPAAVFVDAKTARREGSHILLDDGSKVKSGVLVDSHGRPRQVQRPQQMFTRWYGFSLTFPGCEVFGS